MAEIQEIIKATKKLMNPYHDKLLFLLTAAKYIYLTSPLQGWLRQNILKEYYLSKTALLDVAFTNIHTHRKAVLGKIISFQDILFKDFFK